MIRRNRKSLSDIKIEELVPLGILQDAARAGKTLKGFAPALRADFGSRHEGFGFITAITALQRKDGNPLNLISERIVAGEMALRSESFHGDRHF